MAILANTQNNMTSLREALTTLGLDLTSSLSMQTVRRRYQLLLSISRGKSSRCRELSQAFHEVICFLQLRTIRNDLAMALETSLNPLHEDFSTALEALLVFSVIGPSGQSIQITLEDIQAMQNLRFERIINQIDKASTTNSVDQARKILQDVATEIAYLTQMNDDLSLIIKRSTFINGSKVIPRRPHADLILRSWLECRELGDRTPLAKLAKAVNDQQARKTRIATCHQGVMIT